MYPPDLVPIRGRFIASAAIVDASTLGIRTHPNGVFHVPVEVGPRRRTAQHLLGPHHQPGKLHVMPIAQAGAGGIGYGLPVGLEMEGGAGGIERVEIVLIQRQRFLQGCLHRRVLGFGKQFGKGLHQMQVGVGTLVAGDLHDGLRIFGRERGPVAFKMFVPSPVNGIVRPLLDHPEQGLGLFQRLLIPAGSVIFDQGVDNEGFPVETLPQVTRGSVQIQRPEIATVLAVQEPFPQELHPVSRRLQIIPTPDRQSLPMRQGEAPHHPRLGDDLLFVRHAATFAGVVTEQVASSVPVDGRVVPVGKDGLLKLLTGGPRLRGKRSGSASWEHAQPKQDQKQDQPGKHHAGKLRPRHGTGQWETFRSPAREPFGDAKRGAALPSTTPPPMRNLRLRTAGLELRCSEQPEKFFSAAH